MQHQQQLLIFHWTTENGNEMNNFPFQSVFAHWYANNLIIFCHKIVLNFKHLHALWWKIHAMDSTVIVGLFIWFYFSKYYNKTHFSCNLCFPHDVDSTDINLNLSGLFMRDFENIIYWRWSWYKIISSSAQIKWNNQCDRQFAVCDALERFINHTFQTMDVKS